MSSWWWGFVVGWAAGILTVVCAFLLLPKPIEFGPNPPPRWVMREIAPAKRKDPVA
jgi:hypothetical protein